LIVTASPGFSIAARLELTGVDAADMGIPGLPVQARLMVSERRGGPTSSFRTTVTTQTWQRTRSVLGDVGGEAFPQMIADALRRRPS
jgi:hypothetical protein